MVKDLEWTYKFIRWSCVTMHGYGEIATCFDLSNHKIKLKDWKSKQI